MNSWCESCARKNCCYTMEIIPKCYLPTTNTAHGTPETYLAKSLRYSRDSHEIAEQTENNSESPNNCETCKWGEWYRQGYDITMMDDECGGCCSWNSKWTPKDEPQTDCETCKHYNPNHEAIACERCLDGKYSRYEPQTERSSE